MGWEPLTHACARSENETVGAPISFFVFENRVRCKPPGPRGEGADGSWSLCGSSTHARNPAMGPERNWVPICASIWDPNPRLGPGADGGPARRLPGSGFLRGGAVGVSNAAIAGNDSCPQVVALAYGVSQGGSRSLEAARRYAREEDLIAWDIFHGNVRVEYHEPRADQLPVATGLHSFALALRCCDGPISSSLPPLLASLLGALGSCS
jgi:hypothetical protein